MASMPSSVERGRGGGEGGGGGRAEESSDGGDNGGTCSSGGRGGGVAGMGGAGGLEARSVGLSTEQHREIPESTLEGVWLGSPGMGQEERMCRLENGLSLRGTGSGAWPGAPHPIR